jgi:hypothetical protein
MLVSAIMIAPTLGNCWSELLTSRVPSKQMWFDCRVAPTIVADNLMDFFIIIAMTKVDSASEYGDGATRHLMWRLRHRLIVTYIFIGVIPIVLLLLMAGVGSYLLAGQFATYIAISNLQSELRHLEAANDALAAQLSTLELLRQTK